MSDRLTYSSPSRNENWPHLIFPLMMLLTAVAIIPFRKLNEYTLLNVPLGTEGLALPVQSIALILFLTLSGLLLQLMLPAKSAPSLKAFAGLCGMGFPFVFLQGFLQIDQGLILNFTGTALMIASWLFSLKDKDKNFIPPIASGLLAGLSCAVSPLYASGALALFLFSIFQKGLPWKAKLVKHLLWVLALLCGLTPILYRELPLIQDRNFFFPDYIKGSLQFVVRNTPIWAWVFASIGLLVAVLQKQKILLGLILPFFIFHILLTGIVPVEFILPERTLSTWFPYKVSLQFWSIAPTLLFPMAWFTAYGILRVLRGIEQGVRRVNSKQAAKIPAIASCGFVLGFLLKIADLYSFFS